MFKVLISFSSPFGTEMQNPIPLSEYPYLAIAREQHI